MLKRSPLHRKTFLKRTPLRRRRKPVRAQPGEAEWKAPQSGPCACCGRYAPHLERHHVVKREHLKQEGRLDLLYDLRNSMLLHPDCHERHTNAHRRIPREAVPENAVIFAVELFGVDRTVDYLLRNYDCGEGA